MERGVLVFRHTNRGKGWACVEHRRSLQPTLVQRRRPPPCGHHRGGVPTAGLQISVRVATDQVLVEGQNGEDSPPLQRRRRVDAELLLVRRAERDERA